MDFNDYQVATRRTAGKAEIPESTQEHLNELAISNSAFARLLREDILKLSKDKLLGIFCLGLTGEAGETADLVKKFIGHGHALDDDKLMNELGDTLWYLAVIADMMGYSLEDIAKRNIEKLKSRYPDGFDEERSINREGD